MDLRLVVITDRRLAEPRDLFDLVRAALRAGAPAIQLRDKTATGGELLRTARALRAMTRQHGALLFVNDRLDVALAAEADGVHLGPSDLPVSAARRIAPPPFRIGFSTDQPDAAVRAAADGADYIGCGAVFGTTTKPEAADERIGLARLTEVVRAVSVPVVAIGGIEPANAPEIAATGAAGTAVIRSVMAAEDPAGAVRELLAPF